MVVISVSEVKAYLDRKTLLKTISTLLKHCRIILIENGAKVSQHLKKSFEYPSRTLENYTKVTIILMLLSRHCIVIFRQLKVMNPKPLKHFSFI